MGREIRRVPPNWEHPVKRCEHSPWSGGCDYAKRNGGMCHKQLFDEPFGPAMDEWYANWKKWEAGTHEDIDEDNRGMSYWEWTGGPPDPEYYRPAWKEGEATWYQVYQTVGEGSPVTPPFATKQELVDYLVANGDFWDQERGDGGWSRANAESFVEREWAMSGMMVITNEGAEFKAPRDGA